MIGEIFGEYTIINCYRLNKYKKFTLKCNTCGVNKDIFYSNYYAKERSNCNNCKVMGLIGKRFGILEIKSLESINVKLQEVKYNSTCDCGRKIIVKRKALVNKTKKSCGCLGLTTQRVVSKRNYGNYKHSALKRKLNFDITLNDFEKIIIQNCFYCEAVPKLVNTINFLKFASFRKDTKVYVNGVDRVNNDIGYTIDNVVSCCIDCNIKKHATTKNIAKKMINFINKSKHKDLVVIEISTNDVYKYEIDKDTGVLILDRPLNQAIPTNYGYYNLTLQKDGDALDIFVISKYPIKNTAYITPKIIGAYVCKDNEIQDDKLVAILNDEKLDNNFTNNKLKEIRSYLETYKANFKVLEFVGKSEAEEILYQAKEMYKLSTCLTYNK